MKIYNQIGIEGVLFTHGTEGTMKHIIEVTLQCVLYLNQNQTKTFQGLHNCPVGKDKLYLKIRSIGGRTFAPTLGSSGRWIVC